MVRKKVFVKRKVAELPAPVKTSFNLDWLTLLVRPTANLTGLFAKAGYELREKKADEDYQIQARGYSVENRRKIQIKPPSYDINNNLISSGAFDVLFRQEHRPKEVSGEIRQGQILGGRWGDCIKLDLKDKILQEETYEDILHGETPFYSALMPYSGKVVAQINWQKLVKGFGKSGASSRVDLALNLEYRTMDELRQVQGFLAKCCGFTWDSDWGSVKRDQKKSLITAGSSNGKSPIKSANYVISNGGTLYVGSRTSPFFARVYDKTAEMATGGLQIPPTLRFEIECKQGLADFCYEKILESEEKPEKLVAKLWQTVVKAYLTFGTVEVSEILKIGNIPVLPFEISKKESTQRKLSYVLKTQYSKAVKNAVSGLSDAQKLAFILRSLDIDLTADSQTLGSELTEILSSAKKVDEVVKKADKKAMEAKNG